ncbi:ribose-phosphate pyrophosphokinase [bacterium]|nr:ribose-phosphate pyrophosphokinase [bacterium]
MSVDPDYIRVFTGNAHPELAKAICDTLQIEVGDAYVSHFADGEINVEIAESVRGKDVYVVQPTCRPDVNGSLMELLVMLDAFSRASAERITAVIPYYGYARQDRKVAPRAPITAKLVADLLTTAGADRILTVDLHAGQIQGFFNIPVDNLYATAEISRTLEKMEDVLDGDVVVVSPDAGGVRRARYLAHLLHNNAGLAIVDKRRAKPGQVAQVNIIGEVENKIAILVDDMIDSGGTLVAAAEALAERGARRVFALGTHPVFSGDAVRRLSESNIELMLVTDTIPLSAEAKTVNKIRVVTVAGLLANAIVNIHCGGSVSSLFTDIQVIN